MTDPDEPFCVVGVVTRTTNAAEADPATARLPGLWQRAYADPALTRLREQGGTGLVAVLTDYESDHTGAYTEVLGVATSPDALPTDLPEGLVAVSVPAERRHREPARGAMPDALIAAWQRVWALSESGELQRSYRTDYELHGPDGADLFVSVAPTP